jgi:hypothetical protein
VWPVWKFFDAHPVVFVLTVMIIVGALLFLVHLLVTHAGTRGEFRIGPTGLYYRGGDAEPRPGVLRRAWQALINKSSKQGDNLPVPGTPTDISQDRGPTSDAVESRVDLEK